jgi:hypothetical protein
LAAAVFDLPPEVAVRDRASRRELDEPAPAAAMRIVVRTLRGERVALDVDSATTVAQIKGMVAVRKSVAADMQRLFFDGRHLDDNALPVAHYGVWHGSVVFLGLRLRADSSQYVRTCVLYNSFSCDVCGLFDVDIELNYGRQKICTVQMRPEQPPVTVRELINQQQQQRLILFYGDKAGGGDGDKATIKRKLVSRHSLRKILSRLHVDMWTAQHDAKFLDQMLRHTRGGGDRRRAVGDLPEDNWRAIRVELNAAMRSAFPVEDLQRWLAESRREFDALRRVKDHRTFSYNARRRVVVATEAEWKR